MRVHESLWALGQAKLPRALTGCYLGWAHKIKLSLQYLHDEISTRRFWDVSERYHCPLRSLWTMSHAVGLLSVCLQEQCNIALAHEMSFSQSPDERAGKAGIPWSENRKDNARHKPFVSHTFTIVSKMKFFLIMQNGLVFYHFTMMPPLNLN